MATLSQKLQNNQQDQYKKPALIALADDQAIMRTSMRRILEKEPNWRILDFHNGQELIAFLKNNTPDCVITDIFMSKSSGFDVLNFIRRRPMANDIPVIFVTGEASKDDIVFAIEQGVTTYLVKPFEAQDLLQKVRQTIQKYQNPLPQEVTLRLAEQLFIQGKYQESLEHFQNLNAQQPNTPRILFGIASSLFKIGNTAEAIKILKEIVQVNVLYYPAYALLADIEMAQKNMAAARDYLLKELSINGKQPHRRKVLAEIYAAENDLDSATEEVRKALLDAPRDETLLIYMAELMRKNKNNEKAMHFYTRARKHNKMCTAALDGIADMYLQEGHPEKAYQLFAQIQKTHPDQRDVLLARAKLYEKESRLSEALTEVDTYLELDEDNVDALKLKARLLQKLEQNQNAFEIWKKLAERVEDAEVYSRMGVYYLKQNKYKEAITYYTKALELAPENPTYHFNLGFAFEGLSMFERAMHCYQEVIKLQPNHTKALAALQRLKDLTHKK